MVNIEVGQIFSSKAQLYRELGFEPASGMKNREYQNREVSRHLSFKSLDKNKRSIIITEIFLEPKPKIDNRGKHGKQTGNSIYAKEMDLLVLAMMQREIYIDATYNYIFTQLIPLFTTRYEKTKLNNAYGISKEFFIELNTVDTYLKTITNKVQNSFISSLKRLEKKGIIRSKCIYKVIYTKDGESIRATNEEVAIIKKTQNQAFEKLEISPNTFIPDYLQTKLRKETLKILREDTPLYNFWNCYSVQLVNKTLKKVLNKEIELALKEITKLFIIAAHKTMNSKKSSAEDSDCNEAYMPFSSNNQVLKIIAIDSLIWTYYENHIDDENTNYIWQYQFKSHLSWLSGEYHRKLKQQFNIDLDLK